MSTDLRCPDKLAELPTRSRFVVRDPGPSWQGNWVARPTEPAERARWTAVAEEAGPELYEFVSRSGVRTTARLAAALELPSHVAERALRRLADRYANVEWRPPGLLVLVDE